MSFPRYPKYKDSGVEWLGEVPEHWGVTPLKYLVDCLDGKRIPLNSEQRADKQGVIPYWGANCIVDLVDEALFNEALVLLGEDGAPFFDKTKSVAFYSTGPIWPNNHVHVLRPVYGVNGEFISYALNITDYANFIDGSTRDKLTQGQMNCIPLPTPTHSEQTTISTFLDHETAKIDTLITEQERLIALLAEKRQAVISHAVTKGLDPNVPMKDSGVEWLGEVPEHWGVLSTRRIATSVETGGTPSSESPSQDVEDGILWYTPGDFGNSLMLSGSSRMISKKTVDTGEIKIFQPGSVLIVSIGATLGKVGYIENLASANQQINAIIPNERIDGYFLAYSLSIKVEVMKFLSNASTIGIMNQEKTKDIWLAVPPTNEQQTIATFLDHETAKIDELTTEARRAIGLLKERRSALISAAVTGKIDVRGLVGKEAA